MLLSAVSVLVVAQSSSEVPEGLMNNPVYLFITYSVINIISLHYINIIKSRKTDISLVVDIKLSGHDTLSLADTTAF